MKRPDLDKIETDWDDESIDNNNYVEHVPELIAYAHHLEQQLKGEVDEIKKPCRLCGHHVSVFRSEFSQ